VQRVGAPGNPRVRRQRALGRRGGRGRGRPGTCSLRRASR
jgi:hypothetical protein